MEGPEIQYAISGDVHIAYGVVGDGPMDVVFVSGWVLSNFGDGDIAFGSWRHFRVPPGKVESLAGRRRAIVPCSMAVTLMW